MKRALVEPIFIFIFNWHHCGEIPGQPKGSKLSATITVVFVFAFAAAVAFIKPTDSRDGSISCCNSNRNNKHTAYRTQGTGHRIQNTASGQDAIAKLSSQRGREAGWEFIFAIFRSLFSPFNQQPWQLFVLLQMLLVHHKFYRQVKYYAYAPLHLITFRFASQCPRSEEAGEIHKIQHSVCVRLSCVLN